MNSWKVLWNTYYQGASKSAYAWELWRLSSKVTRIAFCVAALLLALGFFFYIHAEHSDWRALPSLVIAEAFFVLVLDHARGKPFASSYGTTDQTMSPAEIEDHRGSRYLIFKNKLTSAGITKSHVNDLFEVLDAKIELETHRNERLNRFLVFVSGFFTALILSWVRGLTPQQLGSALSALAITVLVIGPILWMLPSRREKLKELKYFMRLFVKSND